MENGVSNDTTDLESFEMLGETLRDVFFDPVEDELDDVRSSVEARLKRVERQQEERLDHITSVLKKRLGKISSSYEGLDASLGGLTGSIEKVQDLLKDEEDRSELHNLSEQVEHTRTSLEQSVQDVRKAEAEFHDLQAERHKEVLNAHEQSVSAIRQVESSLVEETEEHADRIETALQTADREREKEDIQRYEQVQTMQTKLLESTKEVGTGLGEDVEEIARRIEEIFQQQKRIFQTVGLATVLILWAIGMSTWLLLT